MPIAIRCTLAAAALLLLAHPGAAAPMPFEGELSLDWLGEPLPPLVITGTGVATLNGSAGGAHLVSAIVAGGLTGTATVPVTDPDVTVSGGARGLQAYFVLGSATLGFGATTSGAPRLATGELPVAGFARLCLLDPDCSGSGLTFPLSSGNGAVGLGVGGLLTTGASSSERISVVAEPWTVGTARVTVTTPSGSSFQATAGGWVHGPASFTTSTALAGGALSAVTPLRIQSESGGLAGFGRLQLRFVPEPGGLAIWIAGIAGLWVLGRARRWPGSRRRIS